MSYKLNTVDSHQVRGAKKAENEVRVYCHFSAAPAGNLR
jgi:hypothetical protein